MKTSKAVMCICDQIYHKGSYTRAVSRHMHFYRHLIAISVEQRGMCACVAN